ncbi:MarR family winged helix-turn-helix transcriptional regulator [Paenibacillus tarimensis]
MPTQNESIGKWFSTIHRYSMIYKTRSFLPLGIGAGQLEVLAILYDRDGISQDELALRLNKDKTTTGRAIQKLEELSFIKREPSEKDRRVNLVSLTAKAWDIHPHILSTMATWTDILMKDFSDEEKAQLLEMVKRVSRNAVNHISKMGENMENEGAE